MNHTLTYHENLRLGFRPKDGTAFTTDALIDQYRRGDIESMRVNQNTFQIPTFQVCTTT